VEPEHDVAAQEAEEVDDRQQQERRNEEVQRPARVRGERDARDPRGVRTAPAHGQAD
jgi:hypothetical protein